MDRQQLLSMDPYILLSWVNTELRDNVDSIYELCSMYDIEPEELIEKLSEVNVSYDAERNQFVSSEALVYEILKRLDIKYEIKKQVPVYTMEDRDKLDFKLPGIPCKNLFLCDSSNKEFIMIVVEDGKHIDLKRLSQQLGMKGLHFASEKQLAQQLGLKMGALGPFGLINNFNGNVKLVVDEALRSADYVSFHPNVNTATVIMTWDDFYKYVLWCKNQVMFEEL